MKISGVQTAAFFFIILFTGLYSARAESPGGQPGTNSITPDSSLVETEATPAQNQSLPAEQQEIEPGQELQPAEQTVITEISGTQSDTCKTDITDGATWIDHVHALVQEKTCEPAVWFDNFFGEDHVLLDLRPGTFIILRNSARLTEGLKVKYATDFYITLDLPNLDRILRKARIYIESGSDADKYTAHPGDPVH